MTSHSHTSTVKARLYRRYHSTRIRRRKGEALLEQSMVGARIYEANPSRLLRSNWQAAILDVGRGTGLRNAPVTDQRQHLDQRSRHYYFLTVRDVLEHFERQGIIEVVELCRVACGNSRP